MGCWNKTCALTGLPIFAGQDVFVFPIVENDNNGYISRCYTVALWHPMSVPFYAKYDDYGGAEDIHGASVEMILEGIRNNLVEMEQGENQYHDIPVTKENFDIDKFFEAVHENRLFISLWGDAKLRVEFVMMRTDAIQYIMDTHVMEDYVGDGKGNDPDEEDGGRYLKYKFADILEAIPEYITLIRDMMNGKNMTESERMFFSHRNLPEILPWEMRNVNLVHNHIQALRQSLHFHDTYSISTAIMEAIKGDRTIVATELLVDLCRGLFIDGFMSETRKVWVPACHEGSQADIGSAYGVLANTINKIAAERNEEIESWG